MKKTYNTKVRDRLEAGRDARPLVKYCVIHVFSGHSVQYEGSQWSFTNEYDAKTNYYCMFNAEKKLHELSNLYPNSYNVGVFVSSRSKYNPPSMCYPQGEQIKAAKVTYPDSV